MFSHWCAYLAHAALLPGVFGACQVLCSAAQCSAGQVLVCGCGWVTVGDGGCWWVLVLRWVRAARETESSAVSSATALVATVNISP